MEGCVFCRIARGELPCYKVAQSEHFLAMLDIAPVREGHVLVIPKQHASDLLALPSSQGSELLGFVQRIARAAMEASGAQGFNLGLNNGPAAGQAVFHAHFHVIPRKAGDGLEIWHGEGAPKERLEAMREKISSQWE